MSRCTSLASDSDRVKHALIAAAHFVLERSIEGQGRVEL